jgi:hypothetical protein
MRSPAEAAQDADLHPENDPEGTPIREIAHGVHAAGEKYETPHSIRSPATSVPGTSAGGSTEHPSGDKAR